MSIKNAFGLFLFAWTLGAGSVQAQSPATLSPGSSEFDELRQDAPLLPQNFPA